MRKFLFLLFMLIIVNFLYASIITYEYNVKNPIVKKVQKGYKLIEFENSLYSGYIGEPQLPYLPIKLLLPAGEVAVSIKVEKLQKTEIKEKIDIMPYQGVKPFSSTKKSSFKKKDKIYESNSIYPKKINNYFTTQFLNGYSILLSSFTPVEYLPKDKKVFYYKKVKVTIKTRIDLKAQDALKNLSSSNQVIGKLEKFVDNPSQRFSYPHSKNRSEYDILLITSEEWENSFQDYIALYEKRGFVTQVATIEDINATMQGVDTQEKIRNYIKQEYQNNQISFVTLAGDVEIVPYRGFYCQVQSTQIYYDNNIPSDLYYSALDGTWNDDSDDLWGEIGEDDLLPEVSVGRLSFSNTQDLNAILHKLTMYLDSPVEGELHNPLLVGEHLWDNPLTWGGDYLDLLIGHHEDNGYTTNGIPSTDNIVKLYDRDMNPQSWTMNQLLQEINNGHSFIHHSGHSNSTYNMRLSIDDITNQHFSQVNGTSHNYTLVYSHGCIAGAFDNNDCIAEKMVDIDNFALAYIGNSRYGWFNEGSTEGPSEHIHREFVDALYGENIGNLGAAHMQSKTESSWWVTAPGQHEEGALRWCFYDCNLLGDPVAYVWTKEPIELQVNYPESVSVGTNNITISISSVNGEVSNLKCAIMQDNQLVSSATSDESGLAILDVSHITTPGNVTLFVSGYNCKIQSYNIMFTTSNQAYPYVLSYTVQAGDDNVLEFGERAYPTILLKNGGNQSANNLALRIISQDEYISSSEVTIPIEANLEPEEEINVSNDSLYFDISSDVPDNYEFEITVLITYNDSLQTYNYLNFMAYNADTHISEFMIDNPQNNIMPGETANLKIILENQGGADLENLTLSLSCENELITIQNSTLTMDNLSSSESCELIFTILASEDIPMGTGANFNLGITASNQYEDNESFTLSIGKLIETFESGDFSMFNWQFVGDQNWTISSDNPYSGNYCAKSGEIFNNESSGILLIYEVAEQSEISFYKKVSSENSYDFLKFFIDGTLMGEWSGEVDWSMESYSVQSGQHVFKWIYIKDQNVSSGDDCAWIDDISFPISSNLSHDSTDISHFINTISAYPNPFIFSNTKNNGVTISFDLSSRQNVELEIFNLKGQRIKNTTYKAVKSGNYIWNLTDSSGKKVSSGIYLYKIKAKNYKKVKKITIIK